MYIKRKMKKQKKEKERQVHKKEERHVGIIDEEQSKVQLEGEMKEK